MYPVASKALHLVLLSLHSLSPALLNIGAAACKEMPPLQLKHISTFHSEDKAHACLLSLESKTHARLRGQVETQNSLEKGAPHPLFLLVKLCRHTFLETPWVPSTSRRLMALSVIGCRDFGSWSCLRAEHRQRGC